MKQSSGMDAHRVEPAPEPWAREVTYSLLVFLAGFAVLAVAVQRMCERSGERSGEVATQAGRP